MGATARRRAEERFSLRDPGSAYARLFERLIGAAVKRSHIAGLQPELEPRAPEAAARPWSGFVAGHVALLVLFHPFTSSAIDATGGCGCGRKSQPEAAEVIRSCFDGRYYAQLYHGVAQSRIPPLLHYILRGYAEGRRPSLELDTAGYLAANADVCRAGVNPLLHYALIGRQEGEREAVVR